MTKEILCATDFSDSSKDALKWSIRLAKQLNSHLTILYTYRLFKQQGEVVIDMKKKIVEEAAKLFVAWEQEMLAGKGITYDFKSEVGFIADRVEEYAKKNSIGFFVMAKGMTVCNKETVDELLRNLQMPFVIVP